MARILIEDLADLHDTHVPALPGDMREVRRRQDTLHEDILNDSGDIDSNDDDTIDNEDYDDNIYDVDDM